MRQLLSDTNILIEIKFNKSLFLKTCLPKMNLFLMSFRESSVYDIKIFSTACIKTIVFSVLLSTISIQT